MALNPIPIIIPTSPELNYVVCHGYRSPGRAQLTGISTEYKYKVQEGYGLEGGGVHYVGRGLSKFTLTLTLWEPEHFVQWGTWSKLLEGPTTLRPFFVSLQHPLLTAAGIHLVCPEKVGQPERQGNGAWMVTIQFLEFRPIKEVIVKPKGGIPGVIKGPVIPPKTAADIALAAMQIRFDTSRDAGR